MRLLMTTDAVGGVWTYSLALARGLTARGWQVTLAVLGPAPRPAQRHEARAIAGCSLLVTEMPLDWMADHDVIMRSGGEVARLARTLEADIVHLNSPALAAHTHFEQPVIAACHSCLASWWEAMRDGPIPLEFERHTALLRRGYDYASALLAPSRSFARQTSALYDIDEPLVVHNGWDAPPPLGLERQSDMILAAGRLWDAGKGIDLLIEAARHISLPVHAAGPAYGPNGQEIDLGPVRHLGVLGETALASWRERAGIFVSCSLYEPFGLAVLEAAASGCALLLSDIPTFRELWDGAAAFTPPSDSKALAENLKALAHSPELVARLGAAARERAAHYSLARMVDGTEQVYRNQLQAAPAAMAEAAE